MIDGKKFTTVPRNNLTELPKGLQFRNIAVRQNKNCNPLSKVVIVYSHMYTKLHSSLVVLSTLVQKFFSVFQSPTL